MTRLSVAGEGLAGGVLAGAFVGLGIALTCGRRASGAGVGDVLGAPAGGVG